MDPQLLSDDEIADILTRADNFTKWLSAVSEHALAEAVNNGKRWPGYKLVEGRSNRVYTDTDAILNVLTTEAGFDASKVTEPLKLLPITKLEKAISKAAFEKHVNQFVVKPPGKPALVPASDKRPEYNSTEGAALDFASALNEELL